MMYYQFIMKLLIRRQLRNSLYLPLKLSVPFSKQIPRSPKPTKNQNYQASRRPVVKIVEVQEQPEDPVQKVGFKGQLYLKNLLIANFALIGAIPLWQPFNIAIVLINGGFLLSQFGHEMKKYLLILNNQHYQQLGKYRRSHEYLRLCLHSFLFLSSSSILMAFHSYSACHLAVIGWYFFSIYQSVIPSDYWPVAVVLIAAILFNLILGPLRVQLHTPQFPQLPENHNSQK